MSDPRSHSRTTPSAAEEADIITITVDRKPGTEVTEAEVLALVGAANVTKVVVLPHGVKLTFATSVNQACRIAEQLSRQDKFELIVYED